jgi:predicted O-linked N-acetylglucosamine transferase (SPINDLY family)
MRLIDEGNVIEDEGRLAEALQRYEAAICLAPTLARAHLNRGAILLAMGDTEGALGAFATALVHNPDYPAAHYNIGNAHARLGRPESAVAAYRNALALKPDFADAEAALGLVHENLGEWDSAVTRYRRAVEINDNFVEAHCNLGNALKSLGNLDGAVASYRRALAIRPDFAGAHYNLGNALKELGQTDAAVASYRRALELKPDLAEAHRNLGRALQDLGQLDNALASYAHALEIKPDFAEAYNDLGNSQQELGRLEDALASYRRALDIDPDFAGAHTNLLFCLSHKDAISPNTLFHEHCRFGEQFEVPLRGAWPQHRNARDPARCLKIGFVSGDFRDHAMAYFIEPVLAHLAAHPALSLHAYFNHEIEDGVTRRFRSHIKHWRAVAGLSDITLANKIGEDGIDILIDCSGHTGGNRLLCFARKPAPVQASWLGYLGTTGLSAMDYYLADRYFLPAVEFDIQFAEKLVYLPATAPFRPDERAPLVNALPALRNGHVTFASFNRLSKLTPLAITLWSRLLRAVPNARMMVAAMPSEGQYGQLIEWFAREGIVRERLSFHPRCDTAAYLALHHQVDICLDTAPYTGGATTNHALWMGVPTLSLAGDTPPGRLSASLLRHVGLDSFVGRDAAEFVRNGLSWADDLAALADVRAGLRARCGRSPTFQPEIVASGMASAFRIMWQRWCAGLPPQAFEVDGRATDDSSQRTHA